MSNEKITVYSRPLCVQCDSTKRALDKLGLSYELHTMDDDDDATRAKLLALGYMRAPVVVVGDPNAGNHWSGFRPDKIKALATAHAGESQGQARACR